LFFTALATDYDGTIAQDGRVDGPTLEALRKVKESGRRLILVTGRELADLEKVFPQLAIFDRIVAENGGLIYTPATTEQRPLAAAPDQRLVAYLRERHVAPLSVGRTIVATWQPHETTVLRGIEELGLELQITFNKGAVMVLPSGVNKATGLAHALAELGLAAVNAVGVGDAENDHALLRLCGCAVAVANAVPTLKESADLVTTGARGAGVAELAAQLIERDAEAFPKAMERRRILIGRDERGGEH
jgi:hydroxymethylpyrimidine pyrophosphatase-like HAD family hydrolase